MRRGARFDRTLPERQHRVNRDIRFPTIRVIGPDGDQLGVMSPEEARSIAAESGLDLVEVAPNVRPPVCRIMDYGKFKYDQAKKLKASAGSAAPTVKTIQFRPRTDEHDLRTKLDHAHQFLERGDKVRFVMRMRGRERAVVDRWIANLRRHFDKLNDVGKIIGDPAHQGRTVSMLIEPLKTGGPKPAAPSGGGKPEAPSAPSEKSDA